MRSPTIGSTRINVARGTYDEAVANGLKLLATHPEAAEQQARTILKRDPHHAPALRLLGTSLRKLGQDEEAEKAELDAVIASRRHPAIEAAMRLIGANRLADAEDRLRSFLGDHPDDAAGLLLLGETLGKLGQFSESERLLRDAVAASPGFLDAKVALANLLEVTARANEGLPLLDAVLARRPDHVATRRFKGVLLANSSRHEEAAALYGELVAEHPDVIAFWISYGDSLRTLGRRMEADAAYRRGLALDRRFGRSWWGIVNLGAVPLVDGEREEIEAALQASRGDPDNGYYLHFAMGAAYAARAEHDAAFRHFDAGNRLRSRVAPFDPAVVEREVERSRGHLTRALLTRDTVPSGDGPVPIFVVGMPRSGSTLVEQILASHPLIEGTAELPIIPILVQTMVSDHGLSFGDSYRELLPRVPQDSLRAIGREYLRRAAQHRRTDRPFFIDKLPHNWADAGFIRMILPEARIIDARRAPMDCCWSNFRLLFARGHPSAHSQEGMAAYYRSYHAMMRHFDEAMPGQVHRIIYERLVEDLEGETRRLLDHVGVPFAPECLSFHENKRSVATASSEQVRRPLNRSGIDAWKPYEPWLGPLKAALGPLIDDYA